MTKNIKSVNIVDVYDDAEYNWVIGKRNQIEIISCDGRLIELKVGDKSVFVIGRQLATAINNAENI